MTSHHEYETTSADGTRLTIYRWNESGTHNIFLLHGYASHSLHLETLALFLAQQGYRVTALDVRGHGKSEGLRGDIDMWVRYEEDILAAISTIRAPFIAIAMGSGGLALLSTMRGSITPSLRGIILANPLVGVLNPPSLFRSLLLRISMRLPRPIRISNLFRNEQLAFAHEVIKSYEQDPYFFAKTSLRFLQGMLCTQKSIWKAIQQMSTPALILISGNDSIADPEASEELCKHYAGVCSKKRYHKSAHLLLEDQEKETVFADILSWLRSQPSWDQ